MLPARTGRGLGLLTATLAVALAVAYAMVAAPDAQAACRGASVPAVRAMGPSAPVTFCLVNRERRRHGLRALSPRRSLSNAALGKGRDMIARRYFAHRSPDGTGIADRILQAGLRGGSIFGENLAWATGRRSSPAGIVRAWMRSPSHRAAILDRRFRTGGLAVVRGAPVRHRGRAATFVLELAG
jgi:uncharacterized protein YkwD